MHAKCSSIQWGGLPSNLAPKSAFGGDVYLSAKISRLFTKPRMALDASINQQMSHNYFVTPIDNVDAALSHHVSSVYFQQAVFQLRVAAHSAVSLCRLGPLGKGIL